MRGLSLYLFHGIGSSLYALADDQTGRSVHRDLPDNTWLLRAEVARSEAPAAFWYGSTSLAIACSMRTRSQARVLNGSCAKGQRRGDALI
jgi:hypothetical protein